MSDVWVMYSTFRFEQSFQQIMINNYFQSSVNRPSLAKIYPPTKRQIERSLVQAQLNRYKLFIMIIARATARVIKSSFEVMHQNTKVVLEALAKMAAFSDKNTNLTLFLAFQKLKVAAASQKKDVKAINNVATMLQRVEKYNTKQAFSKILLHCHRLDKKFIQNFHAQRTYQFARKLNVLFKQKKKATLGTILTWSHFVKSFSKLRVIFVIRNRLQRQAKQTALNKLNRLLIKKGTKQVPSREVSDLKIQLQDMNVQLQNKNESIQRLQTEISQYKIEQSNSSYNNHNVTSYGEYNNNNNNRSKEQCRAHSQKRMSFNQKSIAKLSRNESHDNISINDISVGSILGNLNKSRTDSASRFQQSNDCSCGFRTKYKKYRNLYDSLKNQLQIVKEQLQVAKDLNEHFTNEIRQYLSGQSNEGDYQQLKRQHSLLQQQRDQLREKVFKYQKHINNLKAEFKVKMEELYRKVRKDM